MNEQAQLQSDDDDCTLCNGQGWYEISRTSDEEGVSIEEHLCSCAAAIELLKQQNDEQADYIAKLESESEAMKAWEKVAELEAQLDQLRSGRWMPVADGAYHYQGNDIVVQGNLLGVAQHGNQVYAGALPDTKRLCEWVEGEDMPADVRQNILDMCDDWKQSGYEDDERGFDYMRANDVLDWLQRRGGAA